MGLKCFNDTGPLVDDNFIDNNTEAVCGGEFRVLEKVFKDENIPV